LQILIGTIPEELEYELYADENCTLYINKTKDMAPEVDNPNSIVFKMWTTDDGEADD